MNTFTTIQIDTLTNIGNAIKKVNGSTSTVFTIANIAELIENIAQGSHINIEEEDKDKIIEKVNIEIQSGLPVSINYEYIDINGQSSSGVINVSKEFYNDNGELIYYQGSQILKNIKVGTEIRLVDVRIISFNGKTYYKRNNEGAAIIFIYGPSSENNNSIEILCEYQKQEG